MAATSSELTNISESKFLGKPLFGIEILSLKELLTVLRMKQVHRKFATSQFSRVRRILKFL